MKKHPESDLLLDKTSPKSSVRADQLGNKTCVWNILGALTKLTGLILISLIPL